MEIIKANETHIPEILEIYAKARKFMKENGNPTQWEEGYPSREIVEKDIAADHCYVCMENEKVVGVFVFIIGEDPTYRVIYQGAWRSETEYGTIHRIASDGTTKGFARRCFDFCRQKCNYLRIDTHANNKPMRELSARTDSGVRNHPQETEATGSRLIILRKNERQE